MEKAGFFVADYRGRNYYEGPAVSVDRSQLLEALRATKVKVITDQLGKTGSIIYPG